MALVTNLDRYSYDKTRFCDPGEGYWLRNNGTFKRPLPSVIIIHTTNNRRKTSFAGEARFLAEANQVGAHYLVGKEGQVARFLVPQFHIGWHVGEAVQGFGNYEAIGIETHVSIGEHWTDAQRQSLSNLVLDLCAVYPTIGNLRTFCVGHRHIALPRGRKSDPEGFSDGDFHAWRAQLQNTRKEMGI